MKIPTVKRRRLRTSTPDKNPENSDKPINLIEMSEEEDESKEPKNKKEVEEENMETSSETDDEDEHDDEDSDDSDVQEIILIQKDSIESDEPRITEFIKFCLDKGLFDNTFYDYGNAFSVVATKLPVTFERLSNDNDEVDRDVFIDVFKEEFGYDRDIEYIYSLIDEDEKGHITWEEFTEFFLPFVKNVTI